ncbi:L-ribulose-5-phosphate 4-epimerase [Vibrio sp. PP-XX7]
MSSNPPPNASPVSDHPDRAQRLTRLRHKVWQANMDLQKHHLVTFTWGNVSGIDRESGLVVIKPSGVAYEALSPSNMVVVDLQGQTVDLQQDLQGQADLPGPDLQGQTPKRALNPSSDTATHLALYRAYPEIGGIVHTHSASATAWAQAGRAIPALGTTHADYFYGAIPCTRALTDQEITTDYELNTGHVIIETIGHEDPMAIPGIVVKEHGPFSWGKDADQAVHNAVVLETVASMALTTLQINAQVSFINQTLLDKHYLRKHGKNAYYGQIRITSRIRDRHENF